MGMRLNCGSGQRPFGLPRPIPEHNRPCAFCGVSAEMHGLEDPPYHPKMLDAPHRYVPDGPNVFINMDINPRWEPDILADCSSMPMLPDGSAEMIVSHHVAEHASCGDACPMFREFLRILEPGGSLLVFVPDMRALAEAWLQGRLTTQVYMTSVYGAFMSHDTDRHKFGYDRESLQGELMSCGFSRVKPFDWRKISGADLAQDFWILGVEAIR